MKKTIHAFEKSNSLVKKRLIQALVPKLVINSKENKLHIYINPLTRDCKPMEEKVRIEDEWLPESNQSQPDFPSQEVTEIIKFPVLPKHRDESFLHKQYVEEGLSASQIARDLSISKSAILNVLKKAGIELANEPRPTQRRGQMLYGKKVVNGKVVDHFGEMQNIEKMIQLRNDGYSYHKIASILNTMNVATKSRKAKWQGATVMKIIKSHS